MNTAELAGSLLEAVSRSFHLTIRALPAPVRTPIALAYLLARASDTIADSTSAPAEVRLRHLEDFRRMNFGEPCTALTEIQRDIRSTHVGEERLLLHLDACLAWLSRVDDRDRTEIIRVLEKIIHGQALDLGRFSDGTPAALPDAAALDEYTYLVAGCVGEFWTRICQRHLPRYSALDEVELLRLGVHFGKGLQLVNILRDLPADLRTGRCYLPADELAAAGLDATTLFAHPSAARPIFAHWHQRAAGWLDDGRAYIASLRPARLRFGCFLPWRLGVDTLRLLASRPPLETPERIKVPRSTVRTALVLGLVAAFSDRPLR